MKQNNIHKLGIDIGSTTVKVAALDGGKKVPPLYIACA